MAKYKLFIEYNGGKYKGWQFQKDQKTVQGVLLGVAGTIFKNEKIDIQGSGRTDAGVHALEQIAHLEVNSDISPEILTLKFNDLLPFDCTVKKIERTHQRFHARHSAVKRSYIYQIATRKTSFGKDFVWWIKDELNVELMQNAALAFNGMHDFASFGAVDKGGEAKSTLVFINDVEVIQKGEMILIRVAGSHFLWKMVRRMVGVLVECGRGNLSKRKVKKFLEEYSDEPAKLTAPPSGLFLEKIYFEENEPVPELTPVINL